jgi:hypothetical protein
MRQALTNQVVFVLFLAMGRLAVAGSIETQSNPVANGSIVVAAGDPNRGDWASVPVYQLDTSLDAGPELDYLSVQIANDSQNLYLRFRLSDLTPGTPQFFGFRHNVYFDTDQNRDTGFWGSGSFLAAGAEFLLQGASIFNFLGPTQDDFNWNFLLTGPYDDFPATDIETSIPLSSLNNPTRFDFFINGANSNFATEDFYPDFASGGAAGDFFTYVIGAPPGNDADFNNDGFLNCADINALVAVIAAGTNNASFDLNGNGQVNLDDRDAWLAAAGTANLPSQNPYRLGDANLDGVVDGSDFGVWNSNKFTSVAAWCSGDFNADGAVDGSDFGSWNSNKFTASDGSLVPEPGSVGLASAAFLLLLQAVFRKQAM